MPTLVFDIETIGENFDDMDKTTQTTLTEWIDDIANTDKKEQKRLLAQVKDRLGFSPLTGQIVAFGVLDVGKDQGTVFYQTDKKESESAEENYAFKPTSEAEMLSKFWEGAKHYDTFVTFNGRAFDVPFLLARSAVHGIKPTKNLMSNRYVNSQWDNAKHIDLYDQLSYYGAVRRAGNLHLWCRAFGIPSPKAGGVKGNDVAPLYEKGKFIDIARYNVRDLIATKLLYERWMEYMQF